MARSEVAHVDRAPAPGPRRLGERLVPLLESPVPTYVLLAAFCLFGGWLRLTALNRQSLWFDEADIVVRAQQSLGAVLYTFIQPGQNGPLYNLMLHFWLLIVGGVSEAKVRFPSAVAGVLTIPVMYLVGERTLGRRVGLLAAGLMAISPYDDWYSQDAKMYAIAVLLTLLSTLLFIEALRRNRRAWWAGYVVVTTLCFYLHVTTVLVFVAQCAWFLLTWKRWEGRHRAWLISVGFLTVPYLPIAAWAGRVVLGQAIMWQPKVTLWQMVQIEATKFAVNRADLTTQARATWLYGALAAVGLVGVGALGWGDRQGTRSLDRRWMLLFGSLVVLPVLIFYVLTFRQPLFDGRYLIMALPAYLLLVAAGVRVLERKAWPLALVAMGLLIILAWIPLRDVNRSSAAQKEDWRAAYHTIVARAQPNDLVLVHPGYLITTYDFYAEEFPGLKRLKPGTIPSFDVQGFDAHQMAVMVRKEAPGDRVWLVQSPDRVRADDPNLALQTWLAKGGPPLFQETFNGVQIFLYRLPPPSADPPPGSMKG
ncbi:MAG TPA: glycosyltransferase family 39 protein [Thermomicrobiaceae bacterium]|nr:glycosyltransferase family 39 protein [Thermomicrobiaceae bacterium]